MHSGERKSVLFGTINMQISKNKHQLFNYTFLQCDIVNSTVWLGAKSKKDSSSLAISIVFQGFTAVISQEITYRNVPLKQRMCCP